MNSTARNIGLALGLTLAVGAASVAYSQPSRARAIDSRVAAMKTIQASMGAINAELKKPMPETAAVQKAAKTLAQTANDVENMFPAGSGAAVKPTRAKDEIWSNKAGFTAALSSFQVQTSKLNQAALSGDLEAVRAQVPRTAATCGGCHTPFRGPAPAAPAARPS